jgi:hypothetical protein
MKKWIPACTGMTGEEVSRLRYFYAVPGPASFAAMPGQGDQRSGKAKKGAI